ncbi:hypothetical protein [Delftia tsuruhatensis]|uniref:hypothetical protein n=1 Tax=Delftia tsuruhatensis TaxID=180282 RepID=UPI0030CD8E6A
MTDPVNPSPITELPPAPAPTDTPAEFNTKAFATVAAQVTMVQQINAENAKVYQNAVAANERAVSAGGFRDQAQTAAATATTKAGEASGSASAAAGSASAASGSAGAAAGSASTASTQAGIATTQAGNANTARIAAEAARDASVAARDASQGYRDQAAVFATQQIKGSSSTSVTPGAGAKSFTIEANRSFVVGMYVVATSTSDPNTQMSGPVQSYNMSTGALVIAVDSYRGTSAKSDWVIGIAAQVSNGMAQQVITANTTATPGVIYIFNAANVTLTLPTTGIAHGAAIGVRLIAAVSYAQVIAFGSVPFRGQSAGDRYIDKPAFGLDFKYDATAGGWI